MLWLSAQPALERCRVEDPTVSILGEDFEARVQEEVKKRLKERQPAEQMPAAPPTIEPLPDEIEEELPIAEWTKFYSIREHSWAYVDGHDAVWIGMHPIFRRNVGEIVNIDLSMEEEELEQVKAFARIQGKGNSIHKLWSPISGQVVKVNSFVAREKAGF